MLTSEEIKAKAEEYRDLTNRGKGLVDFWEWCQSQGLSEKDAELIELKLCNICKEQLGNVEDGIIYEHEEIGWISDFGICETETFDQTVEKWRQGNNPRLRELESLKPLKRLDPVDALLVFGHFYISLSDRKLEQIFKIPKSTVNKRINDACKKMRDYRE